MHTSFMSRQTLCHCKSALRWNPAATSDAFLMGPFPHYTHTHTHQQILPIIKPICKQAAVMAGSPEARYPEAHADMHAFRRDD